MKRNYTKAKLETLVKYINETLNLPLERYSKTEDGKFVPNVGNFHLDYNSEYGYSVLTYTSEHGFESERIWSGRLKVGPAIVATQAFINGLKH